MNYGCRQLCVLRRERASQLLTERTFPPQTTDGAFNLAENRNDDILMSAGGLWILFKCRRLEFGKVLK
jgi:hypothetical protein